MKIFLKFFLVFSALGVAMGQSALAQKITVEYGYYEDHFDSVSPNNLSSINFKPSDNTINMPFGTHAHWLKINIKNKVDAPLILRVKPTYLDHIVLYGTVNKRVVPIKEHGACGNNMTETATVSGVFVFVKDPGIRLMGVVRVVINALFRANTR